jgi:hypothetical protein
MPCFATHHRTDLAVTFGDLRRQARSNVAEARGRQGSRQVYSRIAVHLRREGCVTHRVDLAKKWPEPTDAATNNGPIIVAKAVPTSI